MMNFDEALMELPKENLIAMMYNALDEMQSWNGQSRHRAIMRSLNARCTEDEDGNEHYHITKEELLKATNCSF